jgi:hypothetical protein
MAFLNGANKLFNIFLLAITILQSTSSPGRI